MSTDQMTAPSTLRPEPVDSAALRALAVRDVASFMSGMVTFGIMLGVTAVAYGDRPWEAPLGSVLVYGGSAQLAAMSVLHLGGALATAVLAGLVVHARVALYGAALQPRFRDQPWWFRVLGPHFIIDQTYLSAADRPELTGARFRRYWGWLGGALLVVWSGSVLLGVLIAPLLPDLPHLVLVPMCLFLAMLVPKLADRVSVVSAVVAAAVALVVAHLVPSAGILAGALAGVAAAVWLLEADPEGES
jgi:predicted branched-subunit amino acid permease